ncbi:MAG TPA: diacylglycerol kinase family protein [Actinomycetota bacterium]|nr:diacylglycerol kinase family protein [Actinomycetota bacterium]
MRAVLIVNPTAHNVTEASFRVVEMALEATFDMELVTTEARGHAAEIAQEAVASGAKSVLVYGGDGTVNETVNGLMGQNGSTDVVLGVLPGGGTNVLARNLGFPNELVAATAHLIDLVRGGRTRRLPCARLRASGPDGEVDRVFSFAAGLVLDAEIVRRVDLSGLRPKLHDWAYILQGFRAFFSIRRGDGPPLRISTPEGGQEAWWALMTLTDPFTYLGKRGIRVAPPVRDAAGLDVVAGRSMKVARTLRWIAQTLTSGRHLRHRDILHLHDQRACRVEAVRPVPAQADGEHLGSVTRVSVDVLPGALSVWADPAP